MKWMKERDLLIAQTMAFVQSVTGKRPDLEASSAAPVSSPAAPLPSPAAPVLPAAAPAVSVARSELGATEVALSVIASPSSPVVAVEVPPAPVAVTPTPVGEAPPQIPAEPARFAKLDIRGDFQSEVRARVANFRANQERFLREREEYCSTTMDKVRAAIRDGSDLPRSSGK